MLDFLALVTFYLALVFGYGSSLFFFFAVGRLGIAQLMYWLQGAPPPDECKQQDQVDALFAAIGIPTSVYDFSVSLTSVAWLQTFFTVLKPFYSTSRRSYIYIATLFGRFLGRAWILVGIPAIVLNLVLDAAGHDYLPLFLRLVGLPSELLAFAMGVSGFVLAYMVGRLVSSPQRHFNEAREMYEEIVGIRGYWFDQRSEPDCYDDDRRALEGILRSYDKLLLKIRTVGRRDDLTIQRLMVLHYQKALALCTVSRYEDAGRAIQLSKRFNNLLNNSDIWEPGERSACESQYFFLEGEICLMLGQKREARDLFQRSLEIDISTCDSAGIAKNQERMALCTK
jgi:tetratricopeptide (TPR) repeat protein